MRDKKTKMIGLDVSPEIFSTYDEAVKTANALKIFISRMIDEENKKDNPYSAYVVIGVSENNSYLGRIILNKNGKRGRPRKIFVCDNDIQDNTNPHLHIFIYGNPADMICKRIRDYLSDKFKRQVGWKKYCDSYAPIALSYIFLQSKSIRTVKKNKDNVLDNDYFQSLIDSANTQERIIFTNQTCIEINESLDVIRTFKVIKLLNVVVCNKLITLSIKNIVSIVNKTYTKIFKFYSWNQAP